MISEKFFKQKLRQEGWESFDLGHADLHIGLTDEEMAVRLLRQNDEPWRKKIKAESSFATKQEADRLITRGMISHCSNILYWADDARPNEKKEFHVRFPYTVGRGFSSDFAEKTTDVLTIVIKRDTFSTNGFHVLTAFPNVERPSAEKTGRTAHDVIRRTDIFLDASPIKKAFLLFSDRSGLHLRYDAASSRGPERLTGWFDDGPAHYSIQITEDACNIRKRNNRMYTPEVDVTKATMYLTDAERYNAIRTVTNYLDAEQRKSFRFAYPHVGKQLDSILQTKDDYSL